MVRANGTPNAPSDPGWPATEPYPRPVPWCEDCSRFLTPTSMGEDGSCPGCGRVLVAGSTVVTTERRRGAPWHFKLMVVAVCGYLGWRLVQGIDWLVRAL